MTNQLKGLPQKPAWGPGQGGIRLFAGGKNGLTEEALPAAPCVTAFTENAHLSMAHGERGKASVMGVLPGGWAMPRSPPVYWPQKETLSGRLVPPASLTLSRVDWALSSVAWLFSENR